MPHHFPQSLAATVAVVLALAPTAGARERWISGPEARDLAGPIVWVIAINASNYLSDIPAPGDRCLEYEAVTVGRAKRYGPSSLVLPVTVYDGRNDQSPPLARARIGVHASSLRWHWTVRPHYLQTEDTAEEIIPCDGGIDQEVVFATSVHRPDHRR